MTPASTRRKPAKQSLAKPHDYHLVTTNGERRFECADCGVAMSAGAVSCSGRGADARAEEYRQFVNKMRDGFKD